MGIIVTPGVDDSQAILTRRQAVFATARGLILSWRDRPQLLWEVAMFGAPPPYAKLMSTPKENFRRMMHAAEAMQSKADGLGTDPSAVPSVNLNMSDSEYDEVYEALCHYVKELERKGAKWRRAKDRSFH